MSWKETIEAQIAELRGVSTAVRRRQADTMQALLDVAVAAEKAEDLYPNMAKVCGIPAALDKLREVGDE